MPEVSFRMKIAVELTDLDRTGMPWAYGVGCGACRRHRRRSHACCSADLCRPEDPNVSNYDAIVAVAKLTWELISTGVKRRIDYDREDEGVGTKVMSIWKVDCGFLWMSVPRPAFRAQMTPFAKLETPVGSMSVQASSIEQGLLGEPAVRAIPVPRHTRTTIMRLQRLRREMLVPTT